MLADVFVLVQLRSELCSLGLITRELKTNVGRERHTSHVTFSRSYVFALGLDSMTDEIADYPEVWALVSLVLVHKRETTYFILRGSGFPYECPTLPQLMPRTVDRAWFNEGGSPRNVFTRCREAYIVDG